jgi:Xaa-Pro aminopeptidase
MRAIEPEEYRERQQRAREAAAARGLRALVSFSRGGGAHDRTADGLWLAGLATPQPFVPDHPGHWRGAGHVVVVVPVDGPVTAVVESEELRPFAVADELLVADDLVTAAGKRLSGRVGVLGADVAPHAWWAALERHAQLEAADEIGYALRLVKSPAERRLLRKAGQLGAQAMASALAAAVPESTEARVAAALVEHVVREGGSIYDVVVSSGPASVTLGPASSPAGWTSRRLQDGDLLRIDAYGGVDGYLFDFARTVVVGGGATEEQEALIDALQGSVRAGIDALRPGVPLSEVAAACEAALAGSSHARRHGVPGHLMGGYWGHGLGLAFEPPWIGPDSGEIVEEGWCLALERRAAVPGLGGAQYEDDVLIGPDGAEVLT